MASSTPTSAPVKKPFLSSPKLDAFANACPPFRFLLHLINNPGNSEAHEKQKWLMSCLTARHDANLKGIVYTRINDQLATASLVNTFIAGFSVVIINKKLDFEYDMVPREVIVGLLGLSFCLSICTVLIAVTIKQHLAEVGSDFLPTYFYDYPWTLSMLSHFATNAVGTFLISGICIYFNRFSLWVSGCTTTLILIMFIYLGIMNLELHDRSLIVFGFKFTNGEYHLPDQVAVIRHVENLEDEKQENEKEKHFDAQSYALTKCVFDYYTKEQVLAYFNSFSGYAKLKKK